MSQPLYIFDWKKRREIDYATNFKCSGCKDGVMLWDKSGWICCTCLKAFCEACCDKGEFDDETDDFCCSVCLQD